MNTNAIISYGSAAAIVIVTLIAWQYIKKQNQTNSLTPKRRIIESLPTLVSTLGVLGTFGGITWGLLSFDTTNLNESIPVLLDGLKTAFFTSLAGMIGSLCLSNYINRLIDATDKGVSDINQAASQICQSVAQMGEDNAKTIKSLQEELKKQSQDQIAFYRSMGAVMDSINNNLPQLKSTMDSLAVLARSQENTLSSVAQKMDDTVLEVRATTTSIDGMKESMEEKLTTTNSVLSGASTVMSEIGNNLGEVVEASSAIVSVSEEMNDEIHKFSSIIRSTMDETNELLTKKFDEFSELLKKSNTESLVKVMEKVTEEFQKQMKDLISRLIQQNFEQLNQSVQRLNTWQIENKEMISQLTNQYKTMADNFERNANSLQIVSDNTKNLVSDGGKLQQLIKALNQVLIEDKRFEEMTKQLLESANLTKGNMQEFEESTKALNDWVRKQRNFVEHVQLLMGKLEDLAKIRDYSNEFWQGTKKGMEDGVNIIQQGSKALNNQLMNLDQQFYARLSATLANLDQCIQAMVKAVNNRK